MPKSDAYARRTAQKMVGDGKLPNKYWVYSSAHWIENSLQEPSFYNGAEYPETKFKGKMFGPFKTFAEATVKFNELAQYCEEPHRAGRIDDQTAVVMEDRLTGVIMEGRFCVSHKMRGPWPSVDIHWEVNDDSRYAREKLGADFH